MPSCSSRERCGFLVPRSRGAEQFGELRCRRDAAGDDELLVDDQPGGAHDAVASDLAVVGDFSTVASNPRAWRASLVRASNRSQLLQPGPSTSTIMTGSSQQGFPGLAARELDFGVAVTLE